MNFFDRFAITTAPSCLCSGPWRMSWGKWYVDWCIGKSSLFGCRRSTWIQLQFQRLLCGKFLPYFAMKLKTDYFVITNRLLLLIIINKILIPDWYANNNNESPCINRLPFNMPCCTGLERIRTKISSKRTNATLNISQIVYY